MGDFHHRSLESDNFLKQASVKMLTTHGLLEEMIFLAMTAASRRLLTPSF